MIIRDDDIKRESRGTVLSVCKEREEEPCWDMSGRRREDYRKGGK